jgi:hypothetical protein
MRHEFVEFIPETLMEGILYVSIEYKIVAHLCACGCKREVVTPISPTDWELSFNGTSISLRPSVGNWDFPCKSHYFITRNSIQWAGTFNKQQIEAVKSIDHKKKSIYYGQEDEPTEAVVTSEGFFKRWLSFLFNK